MAFSVSIADVLNDWYDAGVFSYVLPFLLIFAIVYGILDKSRIFSHDNKEGNRGVNGIVAAAVALLSLQFGFVSTFFAEIFPKFGVGIAVIIVLFLLVGLFYNGKKDKSTFYIMGLVLGVATILWAISNWTFWGDYFGIGWWLQDNFTWIVTGIIVIVAVAFIMGKKGIPSSSGSGDN